MTAKCSITFDSGTLLIRAEEPVLDLLTHWVLYDSRVRCHRAEASAYSEIVRTLYANQVEIEDSARDYTAPELVMHTEHAPMKHQQEALKAWIKEKRQGIVVMPTGSGKTFFAFLAMANVKRSTLIVVPTIDLLQQWASQLERMFQVPVGMLGGGSKEIREITVSTYDSAVLQMEYIGNKFGLIIFDECHHLPGQVNRMSASMCLAPYRLGLTATPERDDSDETDAVMRRILGKIVYRIHIDELEGSVLAPYVTHRIAVELTPEEEVEYHAARKKYIDFIRAMRIDFQDKSAWGRFVALCFQNKGGRAVFDAFLRQREIARCGSGKLQILWRIILKYPGARIIVFTADNDTAYKIGELFCLPVITHKTKAAERKEFLDSFRSGEYPVLVTSKVLNEGVDVPEANVGIVFSGSGSTREHIQRLGRILRRTADGKQAVLYELVSAGTSEMSVSERRRNNRAYQKMPVPGEK